MALRSIVKSLPEAYNQANVGPIHLFRSLMKELPRIMIIYDINIPTTEARKCVRYHFAKHANLKDQDVIDTVTARGYMQLEEFLLQYTQKHHLMKFFRAYQRSSGVQFGNEV